MSLKSREARKVLAVAGIGALAALAAASPASAASITQNYSCGYPLIDYQTTKVTTNVNIPKTVPVNTATGRFDINAEAVLNAETIEGLGTVRAASIGGTAVATATIVPPGAAPIVLDINVTIPRQDVPRFTGDLSQTFKLTGITGSTPSQTFNNEGSVPITLDDMVFNIEARDRNGAPVVLDSQSTDPDSDGNENTFDVPCDLEVGQPTLLETIQVGGGGADTVAPSAPGKPDVSNIGPDSATLTWTGSSDNVGVTGYEVQNAAGAVLARPTTTSTTIRGLTPETAYTVKVVAKDAAGNASAASASTSFTTLEAGDGLVPYFFNLNGTATLKTLSKGTLPLKGTIDAKFDVLGGTFTADLVLNNTRGRLIALGFLPITADVAFVQSGQTTGTLKDGKLATNSKTKIRLPQVYLFGSVPIGAGTCQTKRVSEIILKSTEAEFSPIKGGPIAGTFAISDLQGCGLLNGLISPLAAGGGNTIAATLSNVPKA